MRSDAVIRRDILSRLNSGASSSLWAELLKSLLGRELVAFGVETVKSVEIILDEFSRLGYLSEGGLQDLIAAAYLNDVQLDLRKPIYVKGRFVLRTNLDEKLDGVCGPYCLELQIGGMNYYTWRFVDVYKDNIFYQAEVKQAWNVQPLVQLWSKLSNPAKQEAWVLYKEYSSTVGRTVPTYLKLGIDAISDSVRLFVKDAKYGSNVPGADKSKVITPMQLYDGYNGGPNEPCYKVLPGHDGSVNVYFGDGVWGKPYDPSLTYHLYWLDKTYVEIDMDNLNSESVTSIDAANVALDTLLNPVPLNTTKVTFLISSAENSTNSMDMLYATTYLKSQLARLRGLGSVAQVRSFCNSIEGVQDCHVVADNNRLNIYIKPTLPGDIYFDNIYDWLVQRGVGGMTYTVQPGQILTFNIKVTLLGVLTGYDFSSLSTQVSTELTERYARDKLLFREVISILEIAQIVQSIAPDVRALVELEVIENIPKVDGVFTTSLLPIKNSLYKKPTGAGNTPDTEGWVDNNGLLSSISSRQHVMYWDRVTRWGDSYITTTYPSLPLTLTWDPILYSFRSAVEFPVGLAVTTANATLWRSYQSNQYALLIGPDPNDATKGGIYRTSSSTFGGRASTLYAGGSSLFASEYFENPLGNVNSLTVSPVFYPASFATICLRRNSAKQEAIFFNDMFEVLLTQFTLNTSLNYEVLLQRTYSGLSALSLIQKGDDIFVFSVPATGNGSLQCEVFRYIEGRVDYKTANTIRVLGAPTEAGTSSVCASGKYIFIKIGTNWTCYSWTIDRSVWEIGLTQVGGTLAGVSVSADVGEIYLGHLGDTVVEVSNRTSPNIRAYFTDGNTFTAETKSIGANNINTQVATIKGHIDYDTGAISLTSNTPSLEGIKYSVNNIALPEKTSTYPERGTVTVYRGGSS